MKQPVHLAACGTGPGGFAALALAADGTQLWRRDLDARAHDIVADPRRQICLVVDRKPGRGAQLCRLTDGSVVGTLAPLPDHTFDGHAVFSADGAAIFTTQSANGTQTGRIVVYDVTTGAVLREFSTHGIEPHELVWAAPGLLAIGNGGIVDRYAAEPIVSSLVLLDAWDGTIRRQWVLDDEWETLSIRHLAALPDQRIVFAMQDQDAATDRRPLVGLASPGGALDFLAIPAAAHRRLDGYIGSVAVDRSGAIIAASAPRAGLALFWSTHSQTYLGAIELADVCGLCATATDRRLRVSSGHGIQLEVDLDAARGIAEVHEITRISALGLQWDNHLSWCGGD